MNPIAFLRVELICRDTSILHYRSGRDLNTVGKKNTATESTREVMMEETYPRPSYGRARNYGTQGRIDYSRLRGLARITLRYNILLCGHVLTCFGGLWYEEVCDISEIKVLFAAA